MKKFLPILLIFCSTGWTATTSLKDVLEYPTDTLQVETAGALGFSLGSTLLDADGEIAAWVTQAKSTQAVAGVQFRVNTITTGGLVDVRMESVNASTSATGLANSFPSGNLYCTNTSSYAYTFQSGDDNIWVSSQNFNSICQPIVGDYYAIVIIRPAGSTFNGNIAASFASAGSNFDYIIASNTAAGYVRVTNPPNMAIKLADGTFQRNWCATTYDNFTTTNTTTTMKEIGNSFTPPFGGVIRGFHLLWDADSQPIVVKLYQGTTVADSIILSTGARTSNNGTSHHYFFPSTGTYNAANSTFYITVSTIAGGASATFMIMQAREVSTSLGLYDQTYPGGSFINEVQVKTTVSSTADFIQTPTTSRMFLSVVYDQIDVGSAASTKMNTFIGP